MYRYKSVWKNPELTEKAKELRKAGVLSEVVLWKHLKKKQMVGIDFNRQCVIGNYIVDFFSARYGIAIEVDGSSHNWKGDYDVRRLDWLKSQEIFVIQVLHHDVLKDLEGVLMDIENKINKSGRI